MILPIGHDNSEVRRQPWVTWAIIAVCLLALLATDTDAQHDLSDRAGRLGEAVDYFRQHAYLDAEDPVLDAVRYDVMPAQRSQYVEALREIASVQMPGPERVAIEQAELDRLTDLALGRVEAGEGAEAANPYRRWGLTPDSISVTTLISHMFMHGGWLHLLGNLFLLFIMGPALEDRWGRPLYAAFYLSAGVFAGLFFALLAHDPSVPLVGASGAIAGVMGAFMLRFWHGTMRFAYFFFIGFRVLRGTFEAPAWAMLGLWFATELASAWFWHSAGISTGIAYWAHVGGFGFGAAVAFGVRTAHFEERFVHEHIEGLITVAEGNPAVDEALALREEGDVEGAFEALRREAEQNPDDCDAVAAFWDTAVSLQRAEAAAAPVAALLKILLARGEVELALSQWRELDNLVPAQLADPGALLRISSELAERGEREGAVRALRRAVDPDNRALTPGMAFRAIEHARELDPPSALRACRLALANPDLVDAKRSRLEAQVAELEDAGVAEPTPVQCEEAERQRPVWASDGAIDLPDAESGLESPDLQAAVAEAPIAAVSVAAAAPAPPVAPAATPPPIPAPEPVALPAEEEAAAELGDEIDDEALAGLVSLPRFADLKVVEAALLGLEDDGLRFRTSEQGRARLGYERIQALSVAAVRGLAKKPVLVIDLLLNWSEVEEEALCAVRLRSDRFDARALVPEAGSTADALRALTARLLERCRAVALPHAEAVCGLPFAVYPDLDTYVREVLEIEP